MVIICIHIVPCAPHTPQPISAAAVYHTEHLPKFLQAAMLWINSCAHFRELIYWYAGVDSSPSSAAAMSVTLSDVVPAKPEEAKHMQPRVIELLDSIAHAVQSQQVLMDAHMRKYLQRPIAKIDCSGMASTHCCNGLSWSHPGSSSCQTRILRLFWVSSLTDVR